MERIHTKQLLANSLLDLSRHKPVEKISVVEIVSNCSLSRESFYYHFSDKYALISWIYESTYNIILQQYNEHLASWENSLLAFLDFMKANAHFFNNALDDLRFNGFYDRYYQYAVDALSDSIRKRKGTDISDELLFQLRFYIYGTHNVCTDWVKNGAKEPPERLAANILDSTSPLLRELLS